MAKGKAGNEAAMKTTARACSGGRFRLPCGALAQKPPSLLGQAGGCVHLCHFVSPAARSFRISAKS